MYAKHECCWVASIGSILSQARYSGIQEKRRPGRINIKMGK
jgi:hypothetical protein